MSNKEGSQETRLIEAACQARERAYAPYSGFAVGSSILTASGKIYQGCNVENAAYPEGMCAEAVAIAAMVTGGERKIVRLVVVADSPQPVPPCGGCRQKIAEFADSDTPVIMLTTSGARETRTLAELLPCQFDASILSYR